MSQSEDALTDLKQLIQSLPVIDNHGHNVLRPDQLKGANLLSITSEANGDALNDAIRSLPHLRAAKQLRTLYELPDTATWDEICAKRLTLLDTNPDDLMKKCFQGIHTILIDDGLDTGENVQPYDWHDQYTLAPCKRIVRIEAVASQIFRNMNYQHLLPVGVAIADDQACSRAWAKFLQNFETAINDALLYPNVVGFKSVICYRTGLDITLSASDTDAIISARGEHSFQTEFLPTAIQHSFRINAKGLNDALVISTCKILTAYHSQSDPNNYHHHHHHNNDNNNNNDKENDNNNDKNNNKKNDNPPTKPFQFHTGLGDNDLSLHLSNPSYLQPLIATFPHVPFVLLHSSYPYTREAGYLATVYANTYLDIGEIFPMLSRSGQESVLRSSLELTPTSKLLWSSDGHFFPETYWLANLQGRRALEVVLSEFVTRGDLSVEEALRVAREVLWENANRLYDLKLDMGS